MFKFDSFVACLTLTILFCLEAVDRINFSIDRYVIIETSDFTIEQNVYKFYPIVISFCGRDYFQEIIYSGHFDA